VSKELTVGEFQEGMLIPVNKLSKAELQQREVMWRTLWGWTDDTVKKFLFRIGTQVRLYRRDYKGSIGELGEVKFEPKSVELAAYEKTYNYNDGKYYYEKKIQVLPWSFVAWVEEIIEQAEASEVEVPSLEDIPEEEGVGVS